MMRTTRCSFINMSSFVPRYQSRYVSTVLRINTRTISIACMNHCGALNMCRAISKTAPQQRSLVTVGRRAFAVQGPMVWNSLPDDLCTRQDYESFRQCLKTSSYKRAQRIRDFVTIALYKFAFTITITNNNNILQ